MNIHVGTTIRHHSTFGFRHSPRLAPHGITGFIGVSIVRGNCSNEVETIFAIHGNATFDNSIRHEA